MQVGERVAALTNEGIFGKKEKITNDINKILLDRINKFVDKLKVINDNGIVLKLLSATA